MSVFTVFNNQTDEWVCIFHGREKDVIASLDENMSYVEGSYPYDKYEFIDGVPTERVYQPNPLNDLRMIRDSILSSCDWTQVSDAPVDKQAWADYRQALRDLPAQYPDLTDINDVVWPVPPVL